MKIMRVFLILILVTSLTIPSFSQDLEEVLQRKVSPNFAGLPLSKALTLLAKQYSLNLVAGGTVEGYVTVQLTNVSLGDALNAILMANGYHYLVENDVILVKNFDLDVNGELSTKVFSLKYADGVLLQSILEPMLSKKGKITALLAEPVEKENAAEDQRSEIVVVTDFVTNLREIEDVVTAMDKPRKQLHIEIRLVETLVGNEKQVGLNLPRSIEVGMEGAEANVPFSYKPSEETKKYSGWYELPEGGDNLNLGVLTMKELKATLDYLAADNNSRLLSNPKVLAMNNKKAVITMGTNIPIPELSRGIAGDLITYKEKEVSMNLSVVPRINEGKTITLEVHPMLEEITGYTGETAAPQPITSRREVQTTVMLEDGETVVIGGLIKETENKIVDKVWMLGDIPLLGYLFKHVSTKKEKSDLLIFITTKIIE